MNMVIHWAHCCLLPVCSELSSGWRTFEYNTTTGYSSLNGLINSIGIKNLYCLRSIAQTSKFLKHPHEGEFLLPSIFFSILPIDSYLRSSTVLFFPTPVLPSCFRGLKPIYAISTLVPLLTNNRHPLFFSIQSSDLNHVYFLFLVSLNSIISHIDILRSRNFGTILVISSSILFSIFKYSNNSPARRSIYL